MFSYVAGSNMAMVPLGQVKYMVIEENHLQDVVIVSILLMTNFQNIISTKILLEVDMM